MALISIHAPRTGSDLCISETNSFGKYFNPRSPHGERRRCSPCCPASIRFQSTLPARGATLFRALRRAHIVISIHAPRTGSDGIVMPQGRMRGGFQSTLPARGATGPCRRAIIRRVISIHAPRTGSDPPDAGKGRNGHISIHAPRTGSDQSRQPEPPAASNFNPRSPHGERPAQHPDSPRGGHFNPRSPHGERRHHNWEG